MAQMCAVVGCRSRGTKTRAINYGSLPIEVPMCFDHADVLASISLDPAKQHAVTQLKLCGISLAKALEHLGG